MGRFYYLDLLGEAPQDWMGPDEAWTAIETAALRGPALARARDEALANSADNSIWRSFLSDLNERVATTVETIWIMISDSGKNHLMGRAGEVLGFEAHPCVVGRQ